MDRFHLMTVFVAVAEERGFAAAARRLSLSPPAVTRAVAALEAVLGVSLLTRTTRHVRVTDLGAQYLADSRRVLGELQTIDDAVRGSNSAPRGQIVVTAPVLFGRIHVMPAVVEFLRRYPETSVSALLVDRVVNLIEEGVDVGIRIGELPDSNAYAVPAGRVRRVVCAAPAYLRRHGTPKKPADLKRHTLISASGGGATPEWLFQDGGKPVSVRVAPRLNVTQNDAAIEAALRGFGLTRLLSYQVAALVSAGKLEIVLARYEPPELPIHVVYRDGRQAAAKIRAFVETMVAQLTSVKGVSKSSDKLSV